jgi:hypothetical protein
MRMRLAVSLAVLAIVGALLGAASTFSAFKSTTGDAGNSFAAGTVVLTDNDSGSASISMSSARPGDTDTTCITVTSTGTLASLVRMYGTTGGTGLDAYLNLVITRGTGAAGFDDCTGFTADTTDWNALGAGVVYSGTLQAFPDSYAAGVLDPRTSSPEAWTTGEAHMYRIALTVADNDAAQGRTFTQTFTWEARNTTAYSQVVISDQPASYWKLDEAAGTTATDTMGAVNGTYTSGPVLNQATGVKDAGTAVTFNGTGDWITMADVYGFTGNAAFTLEAWVQPTAATTQSRRILSKTLSSVGWNFYLQPSTAGLPDVPNMVTLARSDAGGVSDFATSTTALTPGTWYHVVGTYDGTNMRVYINGALEKTRASSRAVGSTVISTRISHSTAGQFGGSMDEVAIYTSALSAQQIGEHYAAGRR